MADKYRTNQKFNRAIDYYDYYKKAIILDPIYLNAWICLGILYYQKEDYNKAIANFLPFSVNFHI